MRLKCFILLSIKICTYSQLVYFIVKKEGGQLLKMLTPQGKAQCVACIIETKSDTQTRCNFKTSNGKQPPIRDMSRKFIETCSVLLKERNRRKTVSEESLEGGCL